MPAFAASHPLSISRDGRHLVDAQGKPFLYLADTAWELFHRLTREEAELYLSNRASKGFTVVQAVVLAELEGIREGNAYGERALLDDDPRKPNPKYFEHVDDILAKAERLGLTIAMLPTWGDKWHSHHDQPGPTIFKDERSAYDFARFVGNRYKGRSVIFVLGGDRNVDTKQDMALTRAFARGLKEAAPKNLITYHPRGPGRSSDALHKEAWLDFNMVQSSHTGRDYDNGVNIDHDRKLRPIKPTLDAEPRYENIVVDFYYATANNAVRYEDTEVRMAAYYALLAGAAGHTYGNGNVWQMYAPGRKSVLGANTPWQEALDHPGAFQMRHLRRLFDSRPWERLEPAQDLVVSPNPGGSGLRVRAALANDASFAFVYLPQGEPVAINVSRLGPGRMTAWWWNPRYGGANKIYEGDGVAIQAFTPPTRGPGQDWVLVLDRGVGNFPVPGAARP